MSDKTVAAVPVDPVVDPLTENLPGSEEVPELTLDDLFNEGVNEDEVKKAALEMLLPNGTYTTEPPPKVTIRKDDREDSRTKGRVTARFWAKITMGEVRGAIGFALSAQRFNKLDFETHEDTGKPDISYRNYVQAYNAYKQAYGEAPTSFGHVVQYIRDFPVRLRVIQTAGAENMVVTITAVRAS